MGKYVIRGCNVKQSAGCFLSLQQEQFRVFGTYVHQRKRNHEPNSQYSSSLYAHTSHSWSSHSMSSTGELRGPSNPNPLQISGAAAGLSMWHMHRAYGGSILVLFVINIKHVICYYRKIKPRKTRMCFFCQSNHLSPLALCSSAACWAS